MIFKRNQRSEILALRRCNAAGGGGEDEGGGDPRPRKRRRGDEFFPVELLGDVPASAIPYAAFGLRWSEEPEAPAEAAQPPPAARPPVVRTSRGRTQVLPSRFNDSVLIDPWKKEKPAKPPPPPPVKTEHLVRKNGLLHSKGAIFDRSFALSEVDDDDEEEAMMERYRARRNFGGSRKYLASRSTLTSVHDEPYSNYHRKEVMLRHYYEEEDEEDEEVGDVNGLPADLIMDVSSDAEAVPEERYPSGKPVNARELLLGGVQDVIDLMSTPKFRLNDLIMLVLETLYHGMGFRFATICLKDAKTGQFRARISVGEQQEPRQLGFVFPAVSTQRDLFLLAMENDADLFISDAKDAKIVSLLPAWHKALLPDARSFLVLPLIVRGKPVGFFYADRKRPADEGVPKDETALIKTLKGQVLVALNNHAG